LEKHLIWAQVDLHAYAHNIRELRRITHPKACLMAVVKADGYGHGALEVAREALKNGAERLGVARVNEALPLRAAGLDAPILIFGYSPPDVAETLSAYELTQTVYSFATAKALSDQAAAKGKKIQVHIKVDSGMGRLGLLLKRSADASPETAIADNAVREVLAITRLPGIEVEGIFTHFATADSADKAYANRQLDRFLEFLAVLRREGFEPRVRHAANSAALIDIPASHLDMVRPGIASYGLYPSDEVKHNTVHLKPVMTLKSRIIHLKKVPAGFNVSYGITYQTQRPTVIATVAIGYADGFSRLLSSRGYMLVRGQRAPVVGRVCMDLTMLDVGTIDGVAMEDEVVVFGRQGNAVMTADELAANLNTINYEIVTSITGRVPRVYIEKEY
jgi:alanine racemase